MALKSYLSDSLEIKPLHQQRRDVLATLHLLLGQGHQTVQTEFICSTKKLHEWPLFVLMAMIFFEVNFLILVFNRHS